MFISGSIVICLIICLSVFIVFNIKKSNKEYAVALSEKMAIMPQGQAPAIQRERESTIVVPGALLMATDEKKRKGTSSEDVVLPVDRRKSFVIEGDDDEDNIETMGRDGVGIQMARVTPMSTNVVNIREDPVVDGNDDEMYNTAKGRWKVIDKILWQVIKGKVIKIKI